MPERRDHPATYVTEDGQFPSGPFRRDTPREVFLAAGLADRLRSELYNRSIRFIARQAGLSPQTLVNILDGTTWPDLRTIARLEIAVRERLWGTEHRKNPGYYKQYYPDS